MKIALSLAFFEFRDSLSGMCLTEAAYDLGERVQRGVAAFLQDDAELRMLARQCGPGVLAEVAQQRLTRRTTTPNDNPAELASAVAGCTLFPSLASFAEHMQRWNVFVRYR